MAKVILLFAACLFLFSTPGAAQKARPKPTPKPVATPAPEILPSFPGYSFELRIDDDKSLHLEVMTGYEYEDLNNGMVRKALTEYMAMQTPHPLRRPVGPKVAIRPDMTLDVKTVVDAARTVRVAETAEVRIVAFDGPDLDVPADPKFKKVSEIKPNPLYLLVTLRDGGSIELNREQTGSIADMSLLEKSLKRIFDDREVNGVFRPGSYEIEKTVNISASGGAKFADLIAIAKVIETAGSSSIILQVDPTESPAVLVGPRRTNK